MTDTLVEQTPPGGSPLPIPSRSPNPGGSPDGDRVEPGAPGLGDPMPGRGAVTARVYMTSDLRAATGLTRTHLDFYLREGLVRPTARAESGFLLFDEAELATLRTVLRWRREGIGLKQIRERLGR